MGSTESRPTKDQWRHSRAAPDAALGDADGARAFPTLFVRTPGTAGNGVPALPKTENLTVS